MTAPLQAIQSEQDQSDGAIAPTVAAHRSIGNTFSSETDLSACAILSRNVDDRSNSTLEEETTDCEVSDWEEHDETEWDDYLDEASDEAQRELDRELDRELEREMDCLMRETYGNVEDSLQKELDAAIEQQMNDLLAREEEAECERHLPASRTFAAFFSRRLPTNNDFVPSEKHPFTVREKGRPEKIVTAASLQATIQIAIDNYNQTVKDESPR